MEFQTRFGNPQNMGKTASSVSKFVGNSIVINLDENARWDKLVDKIYFKNEEDMFVYNLSRNHF